MIEFGLFVTCRLVQPTNSKSLVLMFSWLQPNPKPLEQFSAFYVNLGFDVLVVTVEMMQLLRPVHGTHLIAGDILKFMATNESYKSILLHGFSVGGYMWGECLVQINDNAPKYEPLVNRIKGQVWDSMTGSKEISVGQARAITKNLFVQKAVVQFSNFYLRALHNVSTKHYLKAENIFNEKALVVPALLFFSKTDPIGTEQKSLNIIKALEALNIKVTQKCFEDSPHVGHFKKYKEEYTTALIEHLKLCNLIT